MRIDRVELQEYKSRGLVTERSGPSGLSVLNYSKACAWERAWDPFTRSCRGLVIDSSGLVVARPFPKFFNLGEEGADPIDLDAPVRVTDKVDGSLGILVPGSVERGGPLVCTRGSFSSEQALWATAWYRSTWHRLAAPVGWTALFEIVYPANRIVVDYGGWAGMILIGAIDLETGAELLTDKYRRHEVLMWWPGQVVEELPAHTLRQAIGLADRPGKEGWVACTTGPNPRRVKGKQADYVAAHRAVTGLNERRVWEAIRDGADVVSFKEPLPEEFHAFVDQTAYLLLVAARDIETAVRERFSELVAGIADRKAFAASVKVAGQVETTSGVVRADGLLFSLYDGRDIGSRVWELVKPEYRPTRWEGAE